MYYYYDILLNFGSEELYDFYEWESSDALEYVKKIPLFRVSTDTLFDNLNYHITYDEEVLLQIQDKTVLKKTLISILILGTILLSGLGAFVALFPE